MPIPNRPVPLRADNIPCSEPSLPRPLNIWYLGGGHLTTSCVPLSYLIVEKVIYMCICDSSYPRKLAFSYLDELSKEFQRSYEGKIDTVTRPYAFMGFGKSRPSGIASIIAVAVPVSN